MCVICYKPKGVKMPQKNVLEAMYLANSNGCGYCTPNEIHKGIYFDDFYKEVKNVSKNEPCLMHFRLATTGSVKRSNCHPFYDGCTDVSFMHNGIFNVRPNKDITDSEFVFREYFIPIIEQYGLDSRQMQEVVEEFGDYSKLAFMQGDNVKLFGNFIKFGDCYFSNLRFINYLR